MGALEDVAAGLLAQDEAVVAVLDEERRVGLPAADPREAGLTGAEDVGQERADAIGVHGVHRAPSTGSLGAPS